MKISKLHIDQFRHLENLDFDFTYPEDFHIEEKRGKSLDKICFIGQSATGKTGLLELIYEYSINTLNLEVINGNSLFGLKNSVRNKGEVNFLINNEVFYFKNNEVSFKNRDYKDDSNTGGSVTSLIPKQDKKDIFYFKANLVSDKNINFLSTNPIELIEKHSSELQNIKEEYKYRGEGLLFNENYGLLFNGDVDIKIWLHLLVDYLNYRKNFTQKMSELVHSFITDLNKLSSKFNEWQKDNPNTLESFAKEFNYILEHLNLEVDLVNTEYSVPIKNKQREEIIPFQDTSTGTKQLLLTSLPLYSLDTKDSIILIDEPERSLYPNIQMEIMDYYKKLAPDAQFIVATHSPFVAASFEPEERFILYFGKEGKVEVRRGISPIGDDPNDILKNDFDLEFLMNTKGIEAFERFRNLKKLLASENNEEEKDKLLEEILSLANAYKF